MKATYNKTKIMRNAWYLKKVQPSMSFSASLKKAWRNEKLAMMTRACREPTDGSSRRPPNTARSYWQFLRTTTETAERTTATNSNKIRP